MTRTRAAQAAAIANGADDAGTADDMTNNGRPAKAPAEEDGASENEDISEKSSNEDASGREEEEAGSGEDLSIDSEEEAADEEDDAADGSGKNDQKWQGYYDQLKEKYDKDGHCRVKQKFGTEKGTKKQVYDPLAAFVKRQREAYSAGKLKPERIELLKSIKFAFDHNEETWMERIEQLKLYKQQKSHCKVTAEDGKDYGGLPNFVRVQRAEWRKMKKGEKSAMTQERLELLEAIGFDFNPSNIPITDKEKVSTSSSFGDCSQQRLCYSDMMITPIFSLPSYHI